MHDYIAKRIAELEAHAREVEIEVVATKTVIAELRLALQHKSALPLSLEVAEQQGAAENTADSTAPGTPPARAG